MAENSKLNKEALGILRDLTEIGCQYEGAVVTDRAVLDARFNEKLKEGEKFREYFEAGLCGSA